MDYLTIEERYLTYYKFLDGVEIAPDKKGGIGCDLSFNDGITAGYLLSWGEFSSIYLPFFSRTDMPGILPIDMSGGLLKGLSGIVCDYVISVGGTFNFLPIDEVARGVYNALLPNGKFLLGVYPEIFDDNGRDILEMLSKENKLNVSRKLNRLSGAVGISFGRYFSDTASTNIIADTTADEVRDFFRATISYEFKTKDEFNSFFSRLNDSSRLYMVWQIVSGRKI